MFSQVRPRSYFLVDFIIPRLLMERLSCRVLPQRDPIYLSVNGLWVYKLSYI